MLHAWHVWWTGRKRRSTMVQTTLWSQPVCLFYVLCCPPTHPGPNSPLMQEMDLQNLPEGNHISVGLPQPMALR